MATETAYGNLLKDPRWQKKRLEIFQRDGWACRFCYNGEFTLTVHHRLYSIKYKYPWEYPNYYLLTSCEPCHDWVTQLINNGEATCINCYHFKDGYCLCREPTDMIETRCLDWFPIVG